jgi:branched-subunit amino acid transport protein
MSRDVILICLLVGMVNYLFRYLPLRLTNRRSLKIKSRRLARVLDSIGIASICALLVVSCAPPVLAQPQRLLPTLCGFAVLGLVYWRRKSIIFSTISAALIYGVVYKMIQLGGYST